MEYLAKKHVLGTFNLCSCAKKFFFKFIIEKIFFQGINGWNDISHVGNCWVKIELSDVNDNPPIFVKKQAHLSLAENTPPKTSLITLPAKDADLVNV